ncbi:nucleolar RNA-binding Nop10p family protein [Candidatus Woesearchaeota archaeon]|nr:nucleolar RNA-binding Nop10p family protein [Candidatus Woesearchaeota archaeon]
MKHILRCPVCKTYTMKQHCNCGEKAIDMKPAKYSPEDKYARYRREIKKQQLVDNNII